MGQKAIFFLLLFHCYSCFSSTLVEKANNLLNALKPESTHYQHGDQIVRWADQEHGISAISLSDCSGFMNALFRETYGFSHEIFLTWSGTERPLAKTYHQLIETQNQFQNIETLNEVQPGDVVAVEYRDGSDDTGHVMLVTSYPFEVKLNEWNVEIIDSSKSGHGNTDSRYDPIEHHFRDGLGKGTLRIFSNDQKKIIGHAWSDSMNSKRQNQANRHMVIGRYGH